MNKKLGCIKLEMLTKEANVSEMTECRFVRCCHLRNHTQRFIEKNCNVTGFDEPRTLQTKAIGDKGERARYKDDITRSSVWSLFHCDLFRRPQVLISQAQAYNLRLLNSI